MFTQLLTSAAALLLLGGCPVHADYIRWAKLARTVDNSTKVGGNSWGTVIVSVQGSSGRVTGMVCDDYMNENTADFLCRAAGFEHGLEFWRNNWNSYSNRISSNAWYQRYNATFALDSLRCPVDAQRLEDCTHNTVGYHDCSWGEGVVLKCRTEARGVELDNMDVQIAKGSGILSSNGTVVLNGTQSSGLVCAKGVERRLLRSFVTRLGTNILWLTTPPRISTVTS
eukprot:sb/3469616/